MSLAREIMCFDVISFVQPHESELAKGALCLPEPNKCNESIEILKNRKLGIGALHTRCAHRRAPTRRIADSQASVFCTTQQTVHCC